MAKRKATKPAGPVAEGEELGFLTALRQNATDQTARAAYADWLEEHNRVYEAAVQRDRAGVSEVWYQIRRTTDGLFADPAKSTSKTHTFASPTKDRQQAWTKNGARWRNFKSLAPHINGLSNNQTKTYLGVKWSELEIVVLEIRPVEVSTLPAGVTRDPHRSRNQFTVPAPVAPSLPTEDTPPPQPKKRKR